VGTISTDREHTMYNAYWDLKKPVPGRLFVYDEAGNQILEFYDPRYNRGSLTGATKSACRKYKPGETQQIFLERFLLFDISPACPLPPGRYRVQLALNGLLLWEPQQYVAPEEVPEGLDQQMVAYSNVVDIEIRGKPAFQGKTLTQWIEALKDEDPYVRCLAAFTLGKLRDERALPGLIEALKDEKRSVRRNAALALGELRDQTAIDPLIAALKKESLEISWRPGSVREGIRLALLKIGKEDVEPFIKRLEKGDGEVRIIIIGVLAELRSKRAVEPLIPLLKDYSWLVRSSAANALGKIDDERAVEPLIAALKDKQQWVRIGAASSLGTIGDKRAVEPLISLLNDERAGGSAASALGEIKDKRALEPLIKCLNHKSSWTRDCSAEALGKMKDARAVEPLIATLKVTKPRYYQRTQPTVTDERAVRDLRAILGNERIKNRHHVAWALVEIGQPAIGPLTGALQSDDKWLSGAAAEILKKIPASPATEPSTGMQSQQGKVEKQLAWLASEADLVVVAIKEQQIDNRFEIKHILKGSGHGLFEDLEKIDGMDIPPADETKQWIMFLRVEREHGRRLYPLIPTGWFVPYSKGLAQKIVEAIPSPTRWGSAKGGLRMGLRMRKSHVPLGEDILVEIHIQNVDQKNITLYQHLMPMYGYHPYTNFDVVSPDGKRWKLVKPVGPMSEYDFTPALELSPGQTYIHMVRLNKWAVEREPLKPGEKFNLFRPGTYKVTCTYSVGEKPAYVHPRHPPKNAWSGKLISKPIDIEILLKEHPDVQVEGVVVITQADEDAIRNILKEFKKHTCKVSFMSMTDPYFDCNAYRNLLGYGWKAVPYVIEQAAQIEAVDAYIGSALIRDANVKTPEEVFEYNRRRKSKSTDALLFPFILEITLRELTSSKIKPKSRIDHGYNSVFAWIEWWQQHKTKFNFQTKEPVVIHPAQDEHSLVPQIRTAIKDGLLDIYAVHATYQQIIERAAAKMNIDVFIGEHEYLDVITTMRMKSVTFEEFLHIAGRNVSMRGFKYRKTDKGYLIDEQNSGRTTKNK